MAASGKDTVAAVFARPPTTLSALEAAVGNVNRGAAREDTYLIRRNNFAGLKLLYVSLIGRDLASDPDPAIAEIRLLTNEPNLRSLAAAMGAGRPRGGEVQFDPYHARQTESARYLEWRDARGEWHLYDHDPSNAFWKLRDPPFASVRSVTEQAELIERIVAVVRREPLDDIFNGLSIDGRWPQYFAAGPTWKLVARPVDSPSELTMTLSPAMPAAPLVAALGSSDVEIYSGDVHMSTWCISNGDVTLTLVARVDNVEDALVQHIRFTSWSAPSTA